MDEGCGWRKKASPDEMENKPSGVDDGRLTEGCLVLLSFTPSGCEVCTQAHAAGPRSHLLTGDSDAAVSFLNPPPRLWEHRVRVECTCMHLEPCACARK